MTETGFGPHDRSTLRSRLMSTLIPDTIAVDALEGLWYELAGKNSRSSCLMPPWNSIHAIWDYPSLSCSHGYYCHYTIVEHRLLLSTIGVLGDLRTRKWFVFTRSPPRVQGKSGRVARLPHPEYLPQTWVTYPPFTMTLYEGLSMPIPFSGTLLAVRGRMHGLKVFARPYRFSEVVRLRFNDGWLIEMRDASSRAEALRDRLRSAKEEL